MSPSDMPPRAPSGFQYCARALLGILLVMIVAEFDAAGSSLPAPHQVMTWSDIVFGLVVFGVPFAIAARPRTIRDWANVVAASQIIPCLNGVVGWATRRTITTLPLTFDPAIFALDGSLGMQPSFAVGMLFVNAPFLATLCAGMYGAVPFPPLLVAAVEARNGRPRGVGAVPVFLIIACFGYALYHLLPAVGPAATFEAGFPFPRDSTIHNTPRNAMPSLHTTWALTSFLMTRGMSLPVRLTVGIIAAGTILATLGYGEHYLADLVVACPFILFIRGLCAIELPWTATERSVSIAIGAALLLGWGLAVRGAIAPRDIPGLVPAAMLATVVVSWWWERRLAAAEDRALG